jgi:hypothetical protein
MAALPRVPALCKAVFPPRIVLTVVFLLIYVQTCVDARLIHSFQSYYYPLVLWNWRNLAGSLRAPGDLTVWTGRQLSQIFYYGLPGAAVIAAAAGMLLTGTAWLMRAVGKGPVRGTWVIPALILVVLHSRYEYYLGSTLGVLAAVAALNLYVWMPLRHGAIRAAVFVALSVLLYYAAGGPYLVLAAVAVLHEMLVRRRWVTGLACLLLAPGVVLGMEKLLWPAQWPDLADHLFGFLKYGYRPSIIGTAMLWAYFPLCAVAVVFRRGPARLAGAVLKGLRGRRPRRQGRRAPAPASTREAGCPPQTAPAGKGSIAFLLQMLALLTGLLRKHPRLRGFIVFLLQMLVLLGAMATAGYVWLNREHKILIQMEYWSDRGLWDEILRNVRRVPPDQYTYLVNLDVNRALYQTGRLGDEMFAYRQEYELIPPFKIHDASVPLARRMAELYLELGRTNDAEAFAGLYYVPLFLKRLATVKIVKKQTAAARILLNVLSDDLAYGGWARARLERLRDDPEASGDPEVVRLRGLMLPEDRDDLNLVYGLSPAADERMLLRLLETNSANRMAFEYLMGLYLLHGDLGGVARNLARLDDFKDAQGRPVYPALPRHYEEALLLLEGPDGPTFAAIRRRPGESSRQRFAAFVKKYEPFFKEQQEELGKLAQGSLTEDQKKKLSKEIQGRIRAKAGAALADEFAGTYFYYYGCSPLGGER